jgi:hypothetical protein
MPLLVYAQHRSPTILFYPLFVVGELFSRRMSITPSTAQRDL